MPDQEIHVALIDVCDSVKRIPVDRESEEARLACIRLIQVLERKGLVPPGQWDLTGTKKR